MHADIALISLDCGNVYSQCILFGSLSLPLSLCLALAPSLWSLGYVYIQFLVYSIFFCYVYSFHSFRISHSLSHISHSWIRMSALARWNFRAFLDSFARTILMHVHNVIILHNVLCSVTVFRGYFSFLFFYHCRFVRCCVDALFYLLLLHGRFFCVRLCRIQFICFNSSSFITLTIISESETACKIHTECITFFREFEMWFESRICWKYAFHSQAQKYERRQ